MKITKNEKKILKLLLLDAKISDIALAKELKISSQAVGKIRKKLESTIIESYSINLNYSKLGINLFAITHSKLTPEGLDKGELEIEEKLLEEPNIIQINRLPSGNSTHIILYGFKDMVELDDFFHSPKKKHELHKYIETKDIFTFSNHSLIKNNPRQLFEKVIEETSCENIETTSYFKELENFKKKIKE
ncbi:MAG: Lrp/AsnC family transcriptional regulator [Candidatus Pacearchaeota archaeon]|jgi:DNA-binding Lrp family transcriptional regulator